MALITLLDVTLRLMPDCRDCGVSEGRLCTALRHRATSVLPLLPEAETLVPGGGPVDVSLRGGRFGVLHSGLLLRCGGDSGGMELVLPGEALTEAFSASCEVRVTAVVPSKVCWFDIHDVEAAALRDARLSCALLDASTVNSAARQRFARLRTVGSVEERVAKLLVTLVGCIGERDAMGQLRLTLACRRDDIAILLGTTVAALDEAKLSLVEQGLIVLHEGSCIELCDLAGLEDLADMSAGLQAAPPAGRMSQPARLSRAT